jgi:hypothetical protein
VQDRNVHVEIAVYEDVAEPGHASKPLGELAWNDLDFGQCVDGGCVVRDVVAGTRSDVDGNVQGVLSAELNAPFDGPELVGAFAQSFDRLANVLLEPVDGSAQGQQVAANDLVIDLCRAHRWGAPCGRDALLPSSLFK